MDQLVDERNVLTWKHLKKQRNSNWLKFGNLLNKQMLSAELNIPEVSEKAAESTEQPETKEKTEDAGDNNNGNIVEKIAEESQSNIEEIEKEGMVRDSENLHDESNTESNSQLNELDSNDESSGIKRSRDDDDTITEEEPATKKTKN